MHSSLISKMASLPPLSRSFSSEFHVLQEGLRCFSRKPVVVYPSNGRTKTINRRIRLLREGDHGRTADVFHTENEGPELLSGCDQTGKLKATLFKELKCPTYFASGSDSVEKHQRALEAYIAELQNQSEQVPSNPESDITKLDDQDSQLRAGTELGSLERYLSTLKEDTKSEPSTSGRTAPVVNKDIIIENIERARTMQQKDFPETENMRTDIYARKSASPPLYDVKESGNLYLISTLLAINIAVFLFEIASPVRSSDYDLYSLPLVYGAKINDLIMVGEWWRLVTPMFLHSGVLDIGFSSWVLLSFGPQVCKGYGSFTFLLLYILGGISGNFTSVLHTSEPTIGGSGPMFAVIGAWLIYQIQSKDMGEKELSENMFQKAIIATALSFVVGEFGPIDNWTNLGATISGIIFGYCTCPVLQVEETSIDGPQEKIKEQITLTRRLANPFKSLVIFAVFLSVLSSLLFFVEFPLDQLELEELVQIIDY